MKRVHIGNLDGSDSAIYAIVGTRRIKASDCDLSIELWEDKMNVPVLGGASVKTYRISILMCNNIDLSNFERIDRFEVITDVLTNQGTYERFYFTDISRMEITPEEITFEVSNREQVDKLFKIFRTS